MFSYAHAWKYFRDRGYFKQNEMLLVGTSQVNSDDPTQDQIDNLRRSKSYLTIGPEQMHLLEEFHVRPLKEPLNSRMLRLLLHRNVPWLEEFSLEMRRFESTGIPELFEINKPFKLSVNPHKRVQGRISTKNAFFNSYQKML